MPAPTDDLDRIMEVMTSAFDPQFGEAWTRRQVEDALLSGLCHYRILHDDLAGQDCESPPAGFYLSRHIAGEEELLLLAVSPANRRTGIGTALVAAFRQEAAIRGANRLLLEMRDGNPAERLYLKLGFLPIGRRSNYYRNGSGLPVAAITFACDIQTSNANI